MYVGWMLKKNAHENSTPKSGKINISSSLHNKDLFNLLYYFIILIISLRSYKKKKWKCTIWVFFPLLSLRLIILISLSSSSLSFVSASSKIQLSLSGTFFILFTVLWNNRICIWFSFFQHFPSFCWCSLLFSCFL